MSKNSGGQVLLGFEDELVNEKYENQIDFTTNKIGGTPDYPGNGSKPDNPRCPLCNLSRPLVIQIHAPIENSRYHRTLYLFGCINPPCWVSNESWACIRVQIPEKTPKKENKTVASMASPADWCTEADDWGEGESLESEPELAGFSCKNNVEHDEVAEEIEKMCIEEETYNEKEPKPTAELERGSSVDQNVIVEPPVLPTVDLTTLLQENSSLCEDISQNHNLEFVAYFISVWNEENTNSRDERHIEELLQKYQQQNEQIIAKNANSSDGVGEKYEKCAPAHGDKLFQKFLNKIQENPGQLLRYNREGHPLSIYSLEKEPKMCQHCKGPTVFEFQLIPTIISKLKLISDKEKNVTRLDFGTVLIYTCKNSCWTEKDSFKNENVVLQIEKY